VTEIDLVVDAEIVEPLDRITAERLDRRIRLLVGAIDDQLGKLQELVTEAKRGNVHAALGFASWPAYLSDVFKVQVRLERGQRRELVVYLAGEGVSQRVIADVVGADRKTVRKDLAEQVGETGPPDRSVTGLDGKTYTKPKPAPSPRKSFPDILNHRFMALSDDIDRLGQLIRSDRFRRNRAQLEGVEKIPEIVRRLNARLAAVADAAMEDAQA
jgi:ribosomal protein L12E/L44/L45/RPP1/RPP2